MKKISVLLIITILGSLLMGTSLAATSKFKDIKEGAWYEDNVNILVNDSREIIGGYPDGTFRPMDTLKVDQFLTMIIRASGYNLEKGTSYWAQPFIDKAIELGYTAPGDFKDYKAEITREAMCKVVVKAAEDMFPKTNYSKYDQIKEVLLDVDDISANHLYYVLQTYELGIITGYPDFTFKPQRVLTRSEASSVIVRLIDPVKRNKFDYEGLKAKLNGESSYYRDGLNWTDPVKQDNRASYVLDQNKLLSEIKYYPGIIGFDNGAENATLSGDHIEFQIRYNVDGPLDGFMEDVQYLVRRRLALKDATTLLVYLNEKENFYDMYTFEKVLYVFKDYEVYIIEKKIDSPLGFGGYRLDVFIYYVDEYYNDEIKPMYQYGINDGSVIVKWEK